MAPGGELQFESVVPRTDGGVTATACTLCHTVFEAEYFDVGGQQISGAIIVFGMMQAWKMTAAPVVTVTGPYRIGAPAAG